MGEVTVKRYSDELYHHGIKGQRWGKRRFQNKDGSLTIAGKARYGDKGQLYRRGEGLGSGKLGNNQPGSSGNTKSGTSSPGYHTHNGSNIYVYSQLSNGQIVPKHTVENQKRYDPYRRWTTTTGTAKSQYQTTAAGTSSPNEHNLLPAKEKSDYDLIREDREKKKKKKREEFDKEWSLPEKFSRVLISELIKEGTPTTYKMAAEEAIAYAGHMIKKHGSRAIEDAVDKGKDILHKIGLVTTTLAPGRRDELGGLDLSKEAIVNRLHKERYRLDGK